MSPTFKIKVPDVTLSITADGPAPPHEETPTEREIRERFEGWAAMRKQIILPIALTGDSVSLFFTLFRCQHCGRCCTTGAGTPEDIGIFLYPDEQARLAKLLGMSLRRFKRMCRRGEDGDIRMPYPCPFYDSQALRCGIYWQPPRVCCQYPFEPGDNDLSKLFLASSCPASRAVVVELQLMLNETNEKVGEMARRGISLWKEG